MTEKIHSKVFNYGNEKEADWPPRFPKKPGRFSGYWDSDKKKFIEGYPPNPNNNFGTAPIAIMDSIAPRYHEGECKTVESRKEWERLNKQHNMISFSSMEEAKPKEDKFYKQKQNRRDYRKATRAALESWRSNPRHMKQKLNRQGEKQIETLKKSGVDLKDSGITIKD